MALTVGIDTYISLDDANAYFGGRLFAEAWEAADDATKEKALRMATQKIDAQYLNGRKSEQNQALQFPRMLYSDFAGYWVADTQVPQAVKDATCEEAAAMLSTQQSANKRAELQAQGVTSFRIGSISETFGGETAGGGYKLLSQVSRGLLAPWLGGGRGFA